MLGSTDNKVYGFHTIGIHIADKGGLIREHEFVLLRQRSMTA